MLRTVLPPAPLCCSYCVTLVRFTPVFFAVEGDVFTPFVTLLLEPLAADFFAVVFLVTVFFAATFLAGAFLLALLFAALFVAVVFFAATFFVAVFFAVAMLGLEA